MFINHNIIIYSFNVHLWLLPTPRVRGEDHPRDHDLDGVDLLHEHGLLADPAVVQHAVDRDLLRVHHDHGGCFCGKT